MFSDLSAEEAGQIAQQLEQGLGAIERVAFERSRAALQPTNAVVFSDSSDFNAFMPDLVETRFYSQLPGDLEADRFIGLHGALSEKIRALHASTSSRMICSPAISARRRRG